jgi:hypothetical protein
MAKTKFKPHQLVCVSRFRSTQDKRMHRYAIGDTGSIVQGPTLDSKYMVRMDRTGWLLTFPSTHLDIA